MSAGAAAQETAPAEEGPAEEGPADGEGGDAEIDDSLSKYRTPFAVLSERAIGTASKPVEFDWRRTDVQVVAQGNHLFELNNFNSLRAGGIARIPNQGSVVELGLSYVWVWDTPSSELLALTPYRQPGRPERLELDVMMALPLAEGVVTTFPRFFPAAEMVFNVYGGIRYLLYPTGFQGMKFGAIASAVLAPSLTDDEIENLDDDRLDAMQVDPGRYGLMVGFGNDLYFRSGWLISPRLLLAVPLMAPATETDLLFWADLAVAVGLAF